VGAGCRCGALALVSPPLPCRPQPGVTSKIFRTFLCRPFEDGKAYMVPDMAVECGTTQHRLYQSYAAAMALL